MSARPTPGEWQAKGGCICTVEADPQTIGYASNHRNRRPRDVEEDFANARMMAAAKDLYRALRSAYKELLDQGIDPHCGEMRKIRAAFKKAKGKK